MNEELISHYKSLLNTYGYSANSVQWRDEFSQNLRFKLLTDISPCLGSVLDVGAGLAHLYTYLRTHGFEGKYLGLELVDEFVENSNRVMKNDPNGNVECFDVDVNDFPTGFKYGFISGMFNNPRENADEFMFQTLSKLWNVCTEGMAFNILSTNVDYIDEQLFYVDPVLVLNFLIHELNGHVMMRHDYITSHEGYPYEVTFYVRKQPVLIDLAC